MRKISSGIIAIRTARKRKRLRFIITLLWGYVKVKITVERERDKSRDGKQISDEKKLRQRKNRTIRGSGEMSSPIYNVGLDVYTRNGEKSIVKRCWKSGNNEKTVLLCFERKSTAISKKNPQFPLSLKLKITKFSRVKHQSRSLCWEF